MKAILQSFPVVVKDVRLLNPNGTGICKYMPEFRIRPADDFNRPCYNIHSSPRRYIDMTTTAVMEKGLFFKGQAGATIFASDHAVF